MLIDVHTIEAGKLARSYHVEDWMGAIRQLSEVTSVVARHRRIAAGFRAATVSGALQASIMGLSSTTGPGAVRQHPGRPTVDPAAAADGGPPRA